MTGRQAWLSEWNGVGAELGVQEDDRTGVAIEPESVRVIQCLPF
jgi:hypothetical protein